MYRDKNLVDCNFLCYKALCPPATEREVLVDTVVGNAVFFSALTATKTLILWRIAVPLE